MKNHIVFKFLAILLCAVFLLGAVGGAAGIFALTELNLYNRSYEDAYAEMVENWADGLAYNIGLRYASGALGGCNVQLLDTYYGTDGYYSMFDMSKVGYTLTDSESNVLQEQVLDEGITPEYRFSFPAGGRYIRLVEEVTQEEWNQMQTEANENAFNYSPEGNVLYDAVPPEGAEIYNVSMTYLDGSGSGVGSADPLGHLYYDSEGWLNCQFYVEYVADRELPATVTHITFRDEANNVLFEANDPEGVGEFYYDGGNLMFRGNLVEMYAPEVEEASADEMGARATVTKKTPIWQLFEGEFEKQGYYYGTDYDITIYATMVHEGQLFGCTTRHYLTTPDYPSEWVNMEDVEILTPAVTAGSGLPALCNTQTKIWSLDGAECYDTGMYYQEGQEIGILVMGTFDSGEWGLTELGWVQMQDVTLQESTTMEAELAEAPETGDVAFTKALADIYADPFGEIIGSINEGVQFTVLEKAQLDGKEWVLMNMGWLRAEDVTLVEEPPVVYQVDPPADSGQTAVAAEDVNIRSAPNQNSEVLGMLPAGTAVEIIRQEDANGEPWVLTQQGWILSEHLITEKEEQETTEPIQAAGESEPVETTAADTTDLTQVPTEAEGVEPAMADEPAEAAEAPTEIELAEEPTTVDATMVTEPEVSPAPARSDFSTEPTLAANVDMDLNYTEYYNHDTGVWMMAGTVNEAMPEGYTVEMQLAEGALVYQYEWELLRVIYDLRSELPKILGISLLLFAILAVYLCCAAGRKPGTKEIHAGGLNCIPLDLYAFLAVMGVCGAAVMGVEGVQYLAQNSLEVSIYFAAAMAYAASLLTVGFLFACVAQFKTPGGYWWRNSICGYCIKLIVICWNWFLRALVWLGERYDGKLEPLLVRFFKALWKLIKFFWNLFVKCCKWLYDTLMKMTQWMGNKLMRFFSMLPLTWQWLLAGGVMIFALFITVAGRYDMGIVLSILFAFALILYGAHAFGVLLEAVKRMNKGDLDEKVSDQFLVGSFKDFAEELNGLADVAVVAAQKQLKSERMKTELITNVSHDIKTPLTSIINYVDLMEKPHTPEEQEVYLEVLSRQSQRLKKLIDDLMEMSKASTGNLAVDISKVNAGEAINQALGEFADKLDRAQLIPVFRQPDAPIEMMADGRLVWRVMSNLLGNAVKYALPGTRLYVDLTEVDGKVIISMKNISREELNVHADELLERFVRGDVSRNTEGSGLGLNIAQSLMELQKGQLQLLVDGDLFKVTLIFPGV